MLGGGGGGTYGVVDGMAMVTESIGARAVGGVEGEELRVVVGGGGGGGGGEVVGRVTPVYLWCEGLVGRVQNVSCTG